jgi:hypothetical protein
MMEQDFVCFLSPGTFFNEETHKSIDKWDTDLASKIAKSVKERHGATPYGFYFYTKGRKNNELDSSVINKSPIYFLGGKIETLEEIEARNDPSEDILRRNMRNNNIERVLVNTNSWKVTVPLLPENVILDWPT